MDRQPRNQYLGLPVISIKASENPNKNFIYQHLSIFFNEVVFLYTIFLIYQKKIFVPLGAQ